MKKINLNNLSLNKIRKIYKKFKVIKQKKIKNKKMLNNKNFIINFIKNYKYDKLK